MIEPKIDKHDDVLNTYFEMAVILKNDRKRKINDTKDEDHYVDCKIVFGSAAREEILFSHYKHIKTETRIKLAP